MATVRIDVLSQRQMAVLIRDVRRAKGLTQEQLAERTGISRVWVSKFELGHINDPGLSRILAICAALGITLGASYDPQTLVPRDVTKPSSRCRNSVQPTNTTVSARSINEASALLEALANRIANEQAQAQPPTNSMDNAL